jgi:UDP-glucose 4-epimerase
MRVLVTGGAGFIGSNLVEFHMRQGDEVHVLDDLSTGREENIAQHIGQPNFFFTKTDILIFPELEKVVCWADRIYHMAAVVGVLKVMGDSERLLATNISATERVLRFAKVSTRKPRILLASTSEVYGEGHTKSLKETSSLILGAQKKSCVAYSVSKIALEYFGLAFYDHFGLSITILRLFNTIGPRQIGYYGMVVPRFIDSAVGGEPIVVYGTGEQTRSFCDVRDLVAILDKLANNPKSIGEIVNVGQDHEVSINELASLAKETAKSSSEITHISYEKAYGKGYEDIMFRRPDLTKLKQLVTYDYQWDLKATLSDLIANYRRD